MQVDVIRPAELSDELIRTWKAIQSRSELLGSPFLSPEYAIAVARVRSDVKIAVIRDNAEVAGFLAFHADSHRIGHPIGLKLSDLQGAVVPPDASWPADELIRQSGLRAWHFNHLIASQTPFHPYHWALDESPYIDLSDGFEGYRREKKQQRSQLLTKMGRKKRKLAREFGPLRFEYQSTDRQVFQQVLAWKSEQRRRTKTPDVLQFPWVIQLLEDLWTADQPDCHAPLSCLFAGDRLVAAHLGITSRSVLHNWFPAYDTEFYKYSPGLMLLIESMQAAEQAGILRFELGKGADAWKHECQNGSHAVAVGSVDRRPVARLLGRRWYHARKRIKSSRLLSRPAQLPKRAFRRIQNWFLMR